MSRNLVAGVAVLACAMAAGAGAYLALRPSAPVVSSGEPGVSVSPDTVRTAVTPPAPAVTGTDIVVADPPPAAVARAVPAPAAKPAAAAKTVKPAVSGRMAQSSPAPATTAAPSPSQNAGWTGVDKSWPSGNASSPQSAPPVAAPPVSEPPQPPPPPPGPPPKTLEELVVSADAVLGLQLDSTVSSEVARVEDPVDARVTRDVKVGTDVAIPAGTKVLGSVVQADRGGKMKEKARLGVRFHTLVMADGTRLPINTEAIYREGKSPGQESAAKVGAAAVGGAILGAIIGGGKGAAIGGSVGAAGGTAAMMAGGRNPAVLSSGTSVTVRLQQPVTITIERDPLR